MRVSNILNVKGNDIVSVAPAATVATVVKTLQEKRIGAILVMENDAIAGIVSERDIARGLAEHGAQVLDMPVSELMTRKVTTCTPESSIDDIMHMMTESRIRHLPVIDQGRLVGFISIGDVVKNRLQELEAEETQLREYVTGSSY